MFLRLVINRASPALLRLGRLRSLSQTQSRVKGSAGARPRADEEILSFKEVLLICDKGSPLGVLPPEDALNIAKDRGQHLLEVARDATPPVWRLVQRLDVFASSERKKKETRKASKVKELRFTDRTEDNDLTYRAKLAKEFLRKGITVKVAVLNTGRVEGSMSRAEYLLRRFAAQCQEEGLMDAISGAKDARIDQAVESKNPILGVVFASINPLANKYKE